MGLRIEEIGCADCPAEMGGPLSVLKRAAGAVVRGGKTVGKKVGRTVVKTGRGAKTLTPWGGKGWVTRLGEASSSLGLGPVGIACNMPRWSNTPVCRGVKKVSWVVGKQVLERAFMLPPGSLDQAENLLNQVGKDPVKRAAVKAELARRKIPADVIEALDERTRPLSFWERLLASLGFAT